MPRVFFFLVIACVLSGVTVAEARIGDTEAQLVVRFGNVQARMPEHTLEQGRAYVVGERVVLKQREWRVTAVLIEGRCAKIAYARTGPWTEAKLTELLAVNADRWNWNEIEAKAPKWQRTWRREDGLVAKWMYVAGFVIEGQPFVDARARLRETARRAPAPVASR